MRCCIHDSMEAVGVCTNCGSAVCKDCFRKVGDKLLCVQCVKNIYLRKQDEEVSNYRKKRKGVFSIAICIFVFGILLHCVAMYETHQRSNLYKQGAHDLSMTGNWLLGMGLLFSIIFFPWQKPINTAIQNKTSVLNNQSDVLSHVDIATLKSQENKKQSHIGAAIVWMFLICILLFWLPIIGPLIAGLIGGRKAGGVGPAVIAVFLPAIICAILFFSFGTALTGLPLIGSLAGAGGLALCLAGIGPLLLGAVIGGLITPAK